MGHRVWVLGILWLGLVGCVHQQIRQQSPDEETEVERDYKVKTIGDVTGVANAEPIAVSGVGLVVDLQGTGGAAPPGAYRTMLEDYLKKKGVENVKDILNSPNHSMVLVSAMIPAGARKGDPIDVEISLPSNSRASSLRGGYLLECYLFNYDSTKNLSPGYQGSDKLVQGHKIAVAEGPLLVGFGDGDESAKLKKGRIWGGGKCLIDRPFYLTLNSDQQYVAVAMRIADRINETFHGSFRGLAGSEIASAKTKTAVALGVPEQYRHNLPRYLRVVRLMPLDGTAMTSSAYRRALEADLFEPSRTVVAALRLEALGPDSIPVLKNGLKSHHPLVRFTSAEALAYLGSPSCGEELALLAERQPALRSYCLTALASLNEAICHVKLTELLASPSAETRYGAFRALRALDENEMKRAGDYLNESFWLHRVAPRSASLVHLSSSRRAEVVLFGEDAYLEPPFSFLAGSEFTITASPDDERCTISRFSLRTGTQRRQCSLRVEDIIRTMADMGGTYPDVVEMLRQSNRCQCVSCPVAIDALPQVTSVRDLAKAGTTPDGILQEQGAEIVTARGDFNVTPTLFETNAVRRQRLHDDARATLLRDQPDTEDEEPTQTAERKKKWWRLRD
ncbi:MAG: flagellar basal body P-ring protein FlgI [Gemmataceae bacterium]